MTKNYRTNLMPFLATSCFSFMVYAFPFLFALNAYNEDANKRIIVNFMFFVIATIVLLFQKGIIRKICLSLLSVIAIIPNIIVLAFLLMNQTILKSTDFWVVFDTNPSEASGFLTTLPLISFLISAIYVVILLASVFWAWRKEPNIEIHWSIRSLSILCMLLIMVNLPFRANVPSIDFYKSFVKYQKEKIEVSQFYENRKNIHLDVTSKLPQGKKTIVIAIGESHTRKHMQLYGYARPTNPKLAEIQHELCIYKDICSPAIQTLNCMKQILTFSNYETPDMYKQEASIVELAKAAGYTTYWADNHGSSNGFFTIDIYTPTSYRTIAHLCDYYTDQNHSPCDSMVLNRLDMFLSDTATSKVIFLHLIGSHFPYNIHCEEKYRVFNDNIVPSIFQSELTPQNVTIINDYDNSMLYNDYILREIIEKLRVQEGMSAFLYFSDHGEEVFDSQVYAGRSFEKISPSMCQIPLILWRNSAFKAVNPLSIDTNRQGCTDDIIYAMMDLLGIEYAMYDAKRSIFNEKYQTKIRMVQGIPYEELLNRFK